MKLTCCEQVERKNKRFFFQTTIDFQLIMCKIGSFYVLLILYKLNDVLRRNKKKYCLQIEGILNYS
jgi:hypothetical protein